MPWIEKTGEGYVVRWWTAGRGSTKARSAPLKNKPAAEAEAKRIAAQLKADKPARAGALPWAELVKRWRTHQADGADPEPRYVTQGVNSLTRLAEANKWSTTADVAAEQVSKIKPGPRRVLFAFLRWAARFHDQPLATRALVPCRAQPRKPERPLLTIEQVDEVQAKADQWGPGNGALVHLVACYGHRAENLVRARVSAFDGERLTLTVKGGDTIRHPLLPETCARLAALAKGKNPGDSLFVVHLGHEFALGRDFAAWFHHSLAGWGYYDLKRFAISTMLGRGVDAKTVASITGHRTVSLLLNTYARTNESRQQAALAAIAGARALGCPAEKS